MVPSFRPINASALIYLPSHGGEPFYLLCQLRVWREYSVSEVAPLRDTPNSA